MFLLTGTLNPEKEAVNEHCKLRQSSEMVQSPEVAVDKVWFLTLLREAHIRDRVTLGAQVGGSHFWEIWSMESSLRAVTLASMH